jgi:hypothetical protein
MASKPPFKIELIVEGMILKAKVTNISKTNQFFLEDHNSQLSFLLLHQDGGKEVKFEDVREETGIKWLLPREEYKILKPDDSIKFREVEIRNMENSTYTVNWFPFKADLPPGVYNGAIEWVSKETKWEEFDSQNERQRIRGKMKGVWLGKVRSNEAQLILV